MEDIKNEVEEVEEEKGKAGSVFVPIMVVIAIAAFGLAYYFYDQYSSLKKESSKEATQEETAAQLIDKVSKIIVLPEGESPTIATVSDPDKLKSQPFFSKAKKGDKLLLYANAKKAVLYDPLENKIIEVAPISIGQPNPSKSPSISPSPQGVPPR